MEPGSFRFFPPHHYWLSQVGIYSLLRTRLPPAATSIGLDSRLAVLYSCTRLQQASPVTVRSPCNQLHPQTQYRSDQVSDVALFCTLAHLHCRIRFAFAMCRSPPITSFRPCRCQQRPCDSDCLPPDQGDASFFQLTGFACASLGKQKNRPGRTRAARYRCCCIP